MIGSHLILETLVESHINSIDFQTKKGSKILTCTLVTTNGMTIRAGTTMTSDLESDRRKARSNAVRTLRSCLEFHIREKSK